MKTTDELWIDFETYSECDIEEKGGMAYAKHPSTMPLCLGYAFDDEPATYIRGIDELPDRIWSHVVRGGKVFAHNATFDYRIWNFICAEQMCWPALSLDQVVDTMSVCLTFQIPAKLAEGTSALKTPYLKNPEGKKLINMCCKPDKYGNQPDPTGPLRPYFDRLFAYCVQDVMAMRSAVRALPREHLIPKEHEIWKMTYEINTLGVPVDYDAIIAIKEYLSRYVTEAMSKVPVITRGKVQTINQIQKVLEWCASQGYYLPSLSADSVKKALNDENCPDKVRSILILRQELGRSSTAKYTKLAKLAYKNEDGHYYVFDNIQYHGAGPGRWAGRGFQIHNLPRASVPDPDSVIESFIAGEEIEDPVTKGKALIRPMIKAIPDHIFLVSDYSSIENRALHWHAMDFETLDEFKAGLDQYKTMASARYKVQYDEVNKSQRQMGKVIILGCGFGMGKDTFKDTADCQFGMKLSIEEAEAAVKAYRQKYPLVVDLWRELKQGCTRAVLSGQKVVVNRVSFKTAKVKGRLWLSILLPSGKALYYLNPQVKMLHIPGYEYMGKVATVTHEGMNPYTHKWSRLALIPGRITENVVQGTAREIMAQGMLNVRKNMPFVQIMPSVHDELITMVHKKYLTDTLLDEFNTQLCTIPWAPDLPLKAAGWIGNRYRKD